MWTLTYLHCAPNAVFILLQGMSSFRKPLMIWSDLILNQSLLCNLQHCCLSFCHPIILCCEILRDSVGRLWRSNKCFLNLAPRIEFTRSHKSNNFRTNLRLGHLFKTTSASPRYYFGVPENYFLKIFIYLDLLTHSLPSWGPVFDHVLQIRSFTGIFLTNGLSFYGVFSVSLVLQAKCLLPSCKV